MSEEQIDFGFDAIPGTPPAVAPDLRDEIAGVWNMPLGERVEVWFRDGQLDRISGVLDLHRAPDYPWNPRQPLQLRISGFAFSNRDIAHWTKI